MDPGKRNRVVQVEQFNGDKDATTNEPLTNDDTNWLPFCEAWAYVEALSGREYFQSQATQSNVTHKVNILSNDRTRRITTDMRLKLSTPQNRDRRLNIVSIIEADQSYGELILMCVERT